MTFAPTPKFLQQGMMAQLQRHYIETTGCILFLQDDYEVPVGSQTNYADAFFQYCVALYPVYYDLAQKFGYILENNFNDTRVQHIELVCEACRGTLAHGQFHRENQNGMLRKLKTHQKQDVATGETVSYFPSMQSVGSWSDFCAAMQDPSHPLAKELVDGLVEESDRLYDTVFAWAIRQMDNRKRILLRDDKEKYENHPDLLEQDAKRQHRIEIMDKMFPGARPGSSSIFQMYLQPGLRLELVKAFVSRYNIHSYNPDRQFRTINNRQDLRDRWQLGVIDWYKNTASPDCTATQLLEKLQEIILQDVPELQSYCRPRQQASTSLDIGSRYGI